MSEAQQGRGGDLRIATCALFLELANIDDEFSAEERDRILSLIRSELDLSEADAIELVQTTMAELEGALDLWRFTNLINERCSEAEKMRVVEMLWRIVYADGRLESHEDYLVHKVAALLRLSHRQLIAVKLKVLHGGSG
jgi:uncharacterized tellurite resistance protein B-like protein